MGEIKQGKEIRDIGVEDVNILDWVARDGLPGKVTMSTDKA